MKLLKMRGIAVGLACLLAANANAALVEGQDYEVMAKAVPQLQKDKVEVLEFFGYFCVHCYHLDPILLKHAKAWPNDVYLRSEHVVWQPEMMGFARIAAAVNQSGLKMQANPAIFKAVYEEKRRLEDPAVFKEWAGAQTSFDGKKLLAAYDSFSNQAEAKKMSDLTQEYQITGTPTLIVGGKYKILFTGNDWNTNMQKVEEMIQKVRTERGMKTPAAKAAPAIKSKGASIAKVANK